MAGIPATVVDCIKGAKQVAHLGTAFDDKPHVAPLWYRYADGTVEIATTGQKLANLRRNPRVALSIQSAEDGMPEWRVLLRGTATVETDEQASRQGKRRIHEKYGVDPDAFPENVLVRIEVGSASYQTF